MTRTMSAHFDGNVIVPDEPVQLPVGQRLTVSIELASAARPRFADLANFEADLPDAPQDLAEQHDHYLYGSPKQ